MQQHELAELKLPDMPRRGQQPHDGLEFLVGERVVGEPHFELLLQFAQPPWHPDACGELKNVLEMLNLPLLRNECDFDLIQESLDAIQRGTGWQNVRNWFVSIFENPD